MLKLCIILLVAVDNLEDVLKNMSQEDFKSKYGRDKPGKNFNIIFSCNSGTRSAKAQKLAINLGYTK